MTLQLLRTVLFVRDLPRMTAFYRDVLGLSPIDDGQTQDWVEFRAGAMTLGLHAIPADIAAACTPEIPPRAREGNPLRLDLSVPDVETEKRRLAALGVTLLARPWGACDLVDPEGNVFGLRDGRGALS
jgi:catechol 2,3-dioxygenase-like lactoylglutathione lyase family enzyme